MRISIELKRKKGQIALDQIRCIDKTRLFEKIDGLNKPSITKLKEILSEDLVE